MDATKFKGQKFPLTSFTTNFEQRTLSLAKQKPSDVFQSTMNTVHGQFCFCLQKLPCVDAALDGHWEDL